MNKSTTQPVDALSEAKPIFEAVLVAFYKFTDGPLFDLD